MKHLELHILQSFPVTCLNRDDLGSPKTAIFGGVTRARVSSQSWKSAIRKSLKEFDPELFKGVRTKMIVQKLQEGLKAVGITESENINEALKAILSIFEKDINKELDNVKTLIYTTDHEIQLLCKAYIENKSKKPDKLKNAIVNSLNKSELLKDAADIALFGRMVANSPELQIEGAAMFSHALSTHQSDNDLDFFTALDDLAPEDNAGAGMIGTLEFNSATYYRFVALDLQMLADEEHLSVMDANQRKEVVRSFIKAVLTAVPVARKNSMNGNTLPGYVLSVVREKGHPIQLVNAFEKPIYPRDGKSIFQLSKEALELEYKNLKETWNLDELWTGSIPEMSLEEMLNKVVEYVE